MFKQSNNLYLLFFAFIAFCLIRFGLSFDGLYGQDAYEYLRFTESLNTFFKTGKLPKDYFWGIYYPLLGSLLSFILIKVSLALQIFSFISLIFSTIYCSKTIKLVYKEETKKSILILFFSLSPIVFIHSFLVMSDMLSCFFVIASIYNFLEYLESSHYKSFLFAVCFSSIAFFTRYVSILILLPFCIASIINLLKKRQYNLVIFSLFVISVISIPHLLIKSQNSLHFLSHSWLQSWDFGNIFKSNFNTVDGESNNNFINLIYVCFQFFHPVFFVFGFFVIVYIFKNGFSRANKYQKLFLVSILLYSLFLGGIPFQNKRFLLLSFPLIVIYIYPKLKEMLLFFKNSVALSFIIVSIQLSMTIYFGKEYYNRNLLEKQISNEMKYLQGSTLYVFDIDIALQGRGLKFNYKNLFLEKYSNFENNALVLINQKQLEKQWVGKNPLINWKSIQKNSKLAKIKTFNKDWCLYKIIAKKNDLD